MSNITMKRAGELLRSIFEILWDKPEGLTAKEVLARIPDVLQLSDEELQISPSTNTPRYEKIVRIATIPLAHAGWLVKNEKGRWFITEDGYQACRRFVNVQDFYKEAIRLYNERKQVAPESVMTLEIAQEMSWSQIEKHLHQLRRSELLFMVTELLRTMNYHPFWTAQPEKQRGQIDLIAYTDPIGANGQRILVQVRQKGQPVTLEGVKGFLSILTPSDFGMLLSMSGYTGEALAELNGVHPRRITALEAGSFYDLWKKYYEQLNQEARHLLPLKAIYFLSNFE